MEEHPFAVCIMTPLMLRCQTLARAGEICFVDSTASYDAENHSVTKLMLIWFQRCRDYDVVFVVYFMVEFTIHILWVSCCIMYTLWLSLLSTFSGCLV